MYNIHTPYVVNYSRIIYLLEIELDEDCIFSNDLDVHSPHLDNEWFEMRCNKFFHDYNNYVAFCNSLGVFKTNEELQDKNIKLHKLYDDYIKSVY